MVEHFLFPLFLRGTSKGLDCGGGFVVGKYVGRAFLLGGRAICRGVVVWGVIMGEGVCLGFALSGLLVWVVIVLYQLV